MVPIGYGGLRHSPTSLPVSWTDRSYHVQPLPAPSLSEGKSTEPPEAARFPPLPAEAGFPPWLEVGGLVSALMPSRGSSCQSPSLGGPMWMRSSTWLGYGSVRHQLPLEAWAGTELAQLQQLPMAIAADSYPSHEITEAF